MPEISSLQPVGMMADATEPVLVTVTGTGFEAASIVTFGGVDQATTYVSATQLTFMAPAGGADQVAVTVKNADLTESQPVMFTYFAEAPPLPGEATSDQQSAYLVATNVMIEIDDGQGGKFLMPVAVGAAVGSGALAFGAVVNQAELDANPYMAHVT